MDDFKTWFAKEYPRREGGYVLGALDLADAYNAGEARGRVLGWSPIETAPDDTDMILAG